MNILPSRDRIIQLGSGVVLATMVYFSWKIYDKMPKKEEIVAEAKGASTDIIQELSGFPRETKIGSIQRHLDGKYPGTFVLKESSGKIEVFINVVPNSYWVLSVAGGGLPPDSRKQEFAFEVNL